MRVTRPIMELSRQIKNPKEFMAARNKSVDIYTRRSTMARKSSANSARETSASEIEASTPSRQSEKSRKSTIGRIFGRAFKSSYEKQYEQDQKMSKLKSINEVAALRGVFYNFFDTQAVNISANDSDRVLISMQKLEVDLNPFYEEEDEYVVSEGHLDNSSFAHGYASKTHSIFKGLELAH